MTKKRRLYAIQASFAAAHFYAQPQWDYEKNKAVFGKCFTAFGHGHEYRLRLNFDVSNVQDFAAFEKQAQDSLQGIIHIFDHKHLNFDFNFFKEKIPTTENIAIQIKAICAQQFAPELSQVLVDVMVFENEFIGAKP